MSALEPKVMSCGEFLKATMPFNPLARGRGIHLQLIDISLEDFDRYRSMAEDLLLRASSALLVCNNCRNWLNEMASKNDHETELQRNVIDELGRQCWNYVKYQVSSADDLDRNRGQYGRALMPIYAGRNAPAIATSRLELSKAITNRIKGALVDETISCAKVASAIGDKPFATLTAVDFINVDRIMRNGKDPRRMVDNTTKVKVRGSSAQLNKTDAEKLQMVVLDGQLMVEFGKPADIAFTRPYVIGHYGDLYWAEGTGAALKPVEVEELDLKIEHAEICAGWIRVLNGRMAYIDNDNERLKPTRQDLHNAVCMLAEQGLDVSDTEVVLIEWGRREKQVFCWNNGVRFVEDMNSRPDTTGLRSMRPVYAARGNGEAEVTALQPLQSAAAN